MLLSRGVVVVQYFFVASVAAKSPVQEPSVVCKNGPFRLCSQESSGGSESSGPSDPKEGHVQLLGVAEPVRHGNNRHIRNPL